MTDTLPRFGTPKLPGYSWLYKSIAGVFLIALSHAALAQSGTAELRGTVLLDSVRTPIEGAEVLLPALSKRAVTSNNGKFRIEDIPAGIHEVVVRFVGFTPLTIEIALAPKGKVEREVLMRRVQTLEGVTVEASSGPISFEEHRKLGLGSFLTRAELEQKENLRLTEVVTQFRGARVQQAGAGAGYLYSGRRQVTSIKGAMGNDPTFCYSQVWLDDHLVYRGREGEALWDINSIAPSQIEAIEFYAGPATVPHRYSRFNSQCGVIVIHKRRTLEKPKP